jgi:hypothetical protein
VRCRANAKIVRLRLGKGAQARVPVPLKSETREEVAEMPVLQWRKNASQAEDAVRFAKKASTRFRISEADWA